MYVLVFSADLYLISTRLNKILKRMSRFSQRALGIPEPSFNVGGNQLLLIEEWIQHFTQLVLTAREEMSRNHETEMRESEALKAAMMEASLDAIVTLDHDGRIIEANPTAERVLGLDRRESGPCLPKFLREPPAGLSGSVRALAQRAPGDAGTRRADALRADGSDLPVELSIVPIDLESERFYTLYIHDITSRKLAEREITSLARFASESPNPIMRVTADGLIVYANHRARVAAGLGCRAGQRLPEDWTGKWPRPSRPASRASASRGGWSGLFAPVRAYPGPRLCEHLRARHHRRAPRRAGVPPAPSGAGACLSPEHHGRGGYRHGA